MIDLASWHQAKGAAGSRNTKHAFIHRNYFTGTNGSSPPTTIINATVPRKNQQIYFPTAFLFAKSSSISTFISSGFVLGPNRLYGAPSWSTKNFAKFHRISFVPSSAGRLCFKKEYTSRVSFPLTWPFSNQVNLSLAWKFFSTNSRISSWVPFVERGNRSSAVLMSSVIHWSQ